jgi:hypothetical protein
MIQAFANAQDTNATACEALTFVSVLKYIGSSRPTTTMTNNNVRSLGSCKPHHCIVNHLVNQRTISGGDNNINDHI